MRQRWDKEHLKRYVISLRIEDDAELIEYIEANKNKVGTTELFRSALIHQINEG